MKLKFYRNRLFQSILELVMAFHIRSLQQALRVGCICIHHFLDLQLKHYYNLENRNKKGRSIEYNSGNFFGIRLLSRGKAFDSNFHRTSNYDFSIGPIWGSQRSYSRIHILFDIGFNYYFDGKGNGGIIPMVEINIGYNLFSK